MVSLRTNYIGKLKQLEKAWTKALTKLTIPLNYPDALGYVPLRDKIAEAYNVNANQILITNSATEAIHLIAKSLTLFVPPNSFFGALRQPHSNTKEASAVYVNSIQHSTTSITLEAAVLAALGKEWTITVFDNPYGLLANKSLRLLHCGTYNIGSFSKVFGPGLRTGYIIADKEQIQELKSLHISMSLSASLPPQELVYHMWPSLKSIKRIRQEQLEEGTKWLNNLGFKTPDPIAGLHTSIKISTKSIPTHLQPYIQIPKGQTGSDIFIPINITHHKRKKLKESLNKLIEI